MCDGCNCCNPFEACQTEVPFSCPICPVQIISNCCCCSAARVMKNYNCGDCGEYKWQQRIPNEMLKYLSPYYTQGRKKQTWLERNRRLIEKLSTVLGRSREFVQYLLLKLLKLNVAAILKATRPSSGCLSVPMTEFYEPNPISNLLGANGRFKDPMDPKNLEKLLRLLKDIKSKSSSGRSKNYRDSSDGQDHGRMGQFEFYDPNYGFNGRDGLDGLGDMGDGYGRVGDANNELLNILAELNLKMPLSINELLDAIDNIELDDLYRPDYYYIDDSKMALKNLNQLYSDVASPRIARTSEGFRTQSQMRQMEFERQGLIPHPMRGLTDNDKRGRTATDGIGGTGATTSRRAFDGKRSTRAHRLDKDKLINRLKERAKKVRDYNPNRRYEGFTLPILLHEPFNKDKPWTWLKRYPTQTRVTDDGKITNRPIRHYKDQETLEKLQHAKRRWSIHSAGSITSGMKEYDDMFGVRDSVRMKRMFRQSALSKKDSMISMMTHSSLMSVKRKSSLRNSLRRMKRDSEKASQWGSEKGSMLTSAKKSIISTILFRNFPKHNMKYYEKAKKHVHLKRH